MSAHKQYDKDKAVELYQSGLTAAKIGKQLGVSDVAILNLLKTRDVSRRPDNTQPKLSPDQVDEASERYKAGESTTVLATAYDVTLTSIHRILRRNGVTMRTASESRRIYTCHHHFFDSIDSEEKAYWLGFIAADGYINTSKKQGKAILVVSLAPEDRSHLERLATSLQSSHPIKDYDYSKTGKTSKPYSTLHIRSEELTSGLAAYGIISKKTYHIRWPNLPQHLLRHFLRGYMDGDGGFYIYTPKSYPNRICTSFRVTSNIPFLQGAQDYLVATIGVSRTKINEHKVSPGIGTLVNGRKRDISALYHLFYDEATIYLRRKREKVAPHV